MENFDFEHYDHNFIRELLTSDISDDSILVYSIGEEYGQNVDNARLAA